MSRGAVRVGVVGAGRWAVLHHLPALMRNPLARVTGVADPDPVKRARVRDLFGVHRCFESSDEMCAAGDLDAVVVATPHAAHYPAARAALAHGLHVLVEKPMTIDPAQAWELVRAARRERRHLVVGYPFQFTGVVARTRALVRTGAMGDVRLVSGVYATARSHLYRPSPAAVSAVPAPDPGTYADPALAGGGQGQTEATHAIANLLWVTGLRVARVSAHMSHLDFPVDVFDTMMFEFVGGALGTLATIGVLPDGSVASQEFRLYGRSGVLTQDLTAGALSGHVAGRPIDVGPAPEAERYPTEQPVNRLVELAAGVTLDNPAPGWLGAEAVSCVAGAYRSARLGGQPVPIHGLGSPDIDGVECLGEPVLR